MLTLLVPLDGSPIAEHAIPTALALAGRGPARIDLVTVHEPPSGVRGVQGAPMHDLSLEQRSDAEVRDALRRYLGDVRHRIEASHPALAVHASLLVGRVADTLADHARETRADAVVMTTHGRGGVTRLWLGSVTDELVRRLDLPVVATRPAERPDDERTDAVVPAPVRRVLVAVDGGTAAESVLAPLLRVVGVEGVEYVLLRVVPPPHPMVRAVATPAEYRRDLDEEQRLAERYLVALDERLRAQGVTPTRTIRRDVPPPTAIVECATEIGADLIAMATRARGPALRMLAGSVADRVLRTAHTAVMLCHVPTAAAAGAPHAARAGGPASRTLATPGPVSGDAG